MQHNRTLRVITAFLLLTAGIILFLILNVCIGTVSIPLKDIFSSIRGPFSIIRLQDLLCSESHPERK